MHRPTLDFRSNESRRHFLKGTAIFSALALARPSEATLRALNEDDSSALQPAFSALKPLRARVHPVTAEELRDRLLYSQKLLTALGTKEDGLFISPQTC